MTPLRDRTTWLRGDLFSCLQPAPGGLRQWRLILLGPPGVGKGTQARLLADALGACPLSTSDIFRSQLERSQNLSLARIRDRMDRGMLLADDYVLGLIRDRRRCLRCRGGFLLEGFPRTLIQAASLDALLSAEHVQLDAVIHYDLPFTELIVRMSGRRVCPRCHAAFHLEMRRPRRAGICDHCGTSLVHRADDHVDAIHSRLTAYIEAAEQVLVHYHRQSLVISVSAGDDPNSVFARTLSLLEERGFSLPEVSRSKPVHAPSPFDSETS